MDTGIKNFYRTKLRAVLTCANIGFYKLVIDQTNFGLIYCKSRTLFETQSIHWYPNFFCKT